MTSPTPEIYKPLAEWPELAAAFAEDLAKCRTHTEALELLAGLDAADKRLIFAACSPQLQRRLWKLKQEEAIAA
ncbi:MAG: hypothetical protein HC771_12250 [Synechococcales cyanobacterium CRU_2_2]|nr:hypothetical protein [Synechococcales cyanobacterium CRU_2_2]